MFRLHGVDCGKSALWQASLPLPTEKPILTITGRITVTNGPGVAEFDRPMLEALGTSGLETTTPWYNGAVRFEGVRMDRLMQEIGATGKTLIVYAINDYSVEVPVDDFRVLGERRSPIWVGVGTAGGAGRWGCGASGAGAGSTSRTAS
jgi:hypothetical protein